jgi:hypothetical protein
MLRYPATKITLTASDIKSAFRRMDKSRKHSSKSGTQQHLTLRTRLIGGHAPSSSQHLSMNQDSNLQGGSQGGGLSGYGFLDGAAASNISQTGQEIVGDSAIESIEIVEFAPDGRGASLELEQVYILSVLG